MSRYQVIGDRAYRGHEPGEQFEARLDGAAEMRAVSRGAIRILERSTTSIQPGSVHVPAGWPFKQEE